MRKRFYYLLFFVVLVIVIIYYLNNNHNVLSYLKSVSNNVLKKNNSVILEKNNNIENSNDNIVDVSGYYNDIVVTKVNSSIYISNDGNMMEIGSISSGVELSLDGIYGEYFLIKNLDDNYYIKYDDVQKIDELSNYSDRFNKYIVFNNSAVTNGKTLLYDNDDNLIFSFNKEFNFPIIIKEDNRYGVKYNDRLLYIHKNECSIVESDNTDLVNTSGISVLNYHFFYDDSSEEDINECNQVICESISKFRKQLDYIKDNEFFTPTMGELEMYIDGKIQLPKSVVITIDDGWRADIGIKILDDYKLNATLFLITASYDVNSFKSDYVEVHSHGDNIHNPGVCYGGQGGAIKCMEHDKLLLDLKISRDKLNGSRYFCYPFYEYNDYSIDVLKEAGYTMAFGGEYENGYKYIVPGIDKFRLPRWVMVNYTDMDTFISYLNLY